MLKRWYALDVGAYEVRIHDFEKHTDGKVRTVLALDKNGPIAYGEEAFRYLYDHTVQVKFPIQEDYVDRSIVALLKHAFQVLDITSSLLKPSVCLVVPEWYDQDRRLQWKQYMLEAGLKKVDLITTVDLLQTKEACFLIHAGHSYTEMGIFVNGTQRAYKRIFFAGSRIDEEIKRIVATKTNCLISNEDARALKHASSDVFWRGKNARLSCTAMDRYQNLVSVEISAADLWPALEMVEKQIVLWAKTCFKEQPFEMKQALLKRGIYLSGGLARCYGLSQYLEQAFSCAVHSEALPEYEIINRLKEIRP